MDGRIDGGAGSDEVVPPDAEAEQASATIMRLLNEHVPLALLADLAHKEGPPSPVILEHEGLPEVAWWETSED